MFAENSALSTTLRAMLADKSDGAILAALQAAVRGGRSTVDTGTVLDGVFKKMLEPREFQNLVYPGLRREDLKSLPQSLQEVLSDPKYAKGVQELVPVAKAKAKSVLDAVKARAAGDGDVMDADTEAALYPGVFQEAFARALVAMVASSARAVHVSQVSTGLGMATAACVPWATHTVV